MDLIIVILIVVIAAGYLIRRVMKHGPGSSCGCDCTSCSPKKSDCAPDDPDKQNRN